MRIWRDKELEGDDGLHGPLVEGQRPPLQEVLHPPRQDKEGAKRSMMMMIIMMVMMMSVVASGARQRSRGTHKDKRISMRDGDLSSHFGTLHVFQLAAHSRTTANDVEHRHGDER